MNLANMALLQQSHFLNHDNVIIKLTDITHHEHPFGTIDSMIMLAID